MVSSPQLAPVKPAPFVRAGCPGGGRIGTSLGGLCGRVYDIENGDRPGRFLLGGGEVRTVSWSVAASSLDCASGEGAPAILGTVDAGDLLNLSFVGSLHRFQAGRGRPPYRVTPVPFCRSRPDRQFGIASAKRWIRKWQRWQNRCPSDCQQLQNYFAGGERKWGRNQLKPVTSLISAPDHFRPQAFGVEIRGCNRLLGCSYLAVHVSAQVCR
jgi:hypothetical protein